MSYENFGLGRLYAPDHRDANFPVRMAMEAPHVPRVQLPRIRPWYRTGPVLYQNGYPRCVGYMWRQWLSSALIMSKVGPSADEIYIEAQKVDEWPGEDYDGTSVRGGAKVLHRMGHIGTYTWATNAEEVKNFLVGGFGTVGLGTDWWTGMFSPDIKGFIHPTGVVEGGHAYLCVGYSPSRHAFRILNSWDESWGEKGRAWVHFDDANMLIESFGEACCATEVKLV